MKKPAVIAIIGVASVVAVAGIGVAIAKVVANHKENI